eukprot:3932037-Rhodomonas_salina.3
MLVSLVWSASSCACGTAGAGSALHAGNLHASQELHAVVRAGVRLRQGRARHRQGREPLVQGRQDEGRDHCSVRRPPKNRCVMLRKH